jgi:hypothetical protein
MRRRRDGQATVDVTARSWGPEPPRFTTGRLEHRAPVADRRDGGRGGPAIRGCGAGV